jgi:hypothetical protein
MNAPVDPVCCKGRGEGDEESAQKGVSVLPRTVIRPPQNQLQGTYEQERSLLWPPTSIQQRDDGTVERSIPHSHRELSHGHTKTLSSNRQSSFFFLTCSTPRKSVCYSPFGTRMPAAHIVTAKLLAAVPASDTKAMATCLTSYIHGTATFDTVFERAAAVDAIVVAMKGIGDAGMIAASLGAL